VRACSYRGDDVVPALQPQSRSLRTTGKEETMLTAARNVFQTLVTGTRTGAHIGRRMIGNARAGYALDGRKLREAGRTRRVFTTVRHATGDAAMQARVSWAQLTPAKQAALKNTAYALGGAGAAYAVT
jgi:hypothetical protein